MKRLAAVLLFLAALSVPTNARADEDEPEAWRRGGPFGVGIILGEPTALTAKFMLNDNNGFQIHLGYGIGRRGRLVLAVDYLFHISNLIPQAPPGRFIPYVGIGGRLGVADDRNNNNALFGVHFPIGLSLFLHAAPIEIFVEIAPGIGLIPGTVVLIDGGIGGRFYF